MPPPGEYKITNKNERIMLSTGIVLALFIGVGIGVLLHSPISIGMLTGFSSREASCITEQQFLITQQNTYLSRQESVFQVQEKLTALTSKIDATWQHAKQSIDKHLSDQEDLLLLEHYYREKNILTNTLLEAKKQSYDAKNALSTAQLQLKNCSEQPSTSIHSASLIDVAQKAAPVEGIESTQSTSPSITPTTPPKDTCRVPGSIKACTPIQKDGKTCRAFQECGQDLLFGTCTASITSCQ